MTTGAFGGMLHTPDILRPSFEYSHNAHKRIWGLPHKKEGRNSTKFVPLSPPLLRSIEIDNQTGTCKGGRRPAGHGCLKEGDKKQTCLVIGFGKRAHPIASSILRSNAEQVLFLEEWIGPEKWDTFFLPRNFFFYMKRGDCMSQGTL